MKLTSIITIVVAGSTLGCASESSLAPAAITLSRTIVGEPPPPRVSGRLIAEFGRVEQSANHAARTMTFVAPALYNRDTVTTSPQLQLLELIAQDASIRADRTSVLRAHGIATLVNLGSGATLTVDLTQLRSFNGGLFIPCGTPLNCVNLNATVTGTIQFPSGPPLAATGSLSFRWETS